MNICRENKDIDNGTQRYRANNFYTIQSLKKCIKQNKTSMSTLEYLF